MQTDLEEMNNEIRAADDKAKKAMAEAGHLAEELRAEQEHSNQIEKFRKGLEHQIKELQVRLDEAEASALKGGKKMIAKLENRVRSSSIKKNRRDLSLNLCIMLVFFIQFLLQVRELESELDSEQRRHAETQKNARKADRRLKELAFQADEDKKNQERLQELIEKLQSKVLTYKRQVEEAVSISFHKTLIDTKISKIMYELSVILS